MKPKNWIVEILIGGTWSDAEWTLDGGHMRFSSKEEAEAEIDELIDDANSENLDYDRNEYRATFSPQQ